MRSPTDSLYAYLTEINYQKLQANESYRRIKEAKNEAETALIKAMTRKQRGLFLNYKDQLDALFAMELSDILSSCTIILNQQQNTQSAEKADP